LATLRADHERERRRLDRELQDRRAKFEEDIAAERHLIETERDEIGARV
jgi:hypothetical protein